MTYKFSKGVSADLFATNLSDGAVLYRVTEEDEGIMTEDHVNGKDYTHGSRIERHDGDADDPDVMYEYKTTQDQSFFERSQKAKRIRIEQLADWRRRDVLEGGGDGKRIEGGLAQSGSFRHRKLKKKKKTVMFEWNVLFMDAVLRNELDEVDRLLKTYENFERCPKAELVNCRTPDGLSPLHQCCIENMTDMASLLIRSGADLRATDPELWTPLHAGATCGHFPVVKILIEAAKLQHPSSSENVDIVRDMLLAVNSDGNMPFDLCDSDQTLAYIEQEMQSRGITQDDIEAKRHKKEVDMLRDLQTFIDASFTLQPHSSSSSSIRRSSSGGVKHDHREIWNRFLAARKTPNAQMMHIAAANGYLEVMDLLLKHKYPVDLEDDDGWQPIHAAVAWNQPAAAKRLVEGGADITAKVRGTGETALDLAVLVDVPEVAEKFRDDLILWDANYKAKCEEEFRKGKVGLLRRRSSESMGSVSGSASPLLRRSSPKSQRVQRKSSLKDKEDLIALLHALGDHDLKSPENAQMTLQKFSRSPGGSLRDRTPTLPNVPEEAIHASNTIEITDVDLINETISSELISSLLRSFEDVEDDDNDSAAEQLMRTAEESLNQIDQPVTLSQLKNRRNRFRMLKREEKPSSTRKLPRESVSPPRVEVVQERTVSCIPVPSPKTDQAPSRNTSSSHSNGELGVNPVVPRFIATPDELPVGSEVTNLNKLNDRFGGAKKKEKTFYRVLKPSKDKEQISDDGTGKAWPKIQPAHGCCIIS